MFKNFQNFAKKVYECPKVILGKILIEESISTSSASIIIGDQDKVYQPSVEDWTQGSESNDSKEF